MKQITTFDFIQTVICVYFKKVLLKFVTQFFAKHKATLKSFLVNVAHRQPVILPIKGHLQDCSSSFSENLMQPSKKVPDIIYLNTHKNFEKHQLSKPSFSIVRGSNAYKYSICRHFFILP